MALIFCIYLRVIWGQMKSPNFVEDFLSLSVVVRLVLAKQIIQ